jgi:hypothetical protein
MHRYKTKERSGNPQELIEAAAAIAEPSVIIPVPAVVVATPTRL